MRLRAWCDCGGSINASSSPPDLAEHLLKTWRYMHDGDGHKECSKEVAARARRRQRKEDAT